MSAVPASRWPALFPHHALLWLGVAAVAVTVFVSRPPPGSRGDARDQPVATADSLRRAAPRAPVAARTLEPSPADRMGHYAWLSRAARRVDRPLAERIEPGPGFARVSLRAGSFGDWLRHLPVAPAPDKPRTPPATGIPRTPRRGAELMSAPHVAAVIDLHPGRGGLLNAANIVLRLRAEYLWSVGPREAAVFNFTSGDRFAWERWAAGQRPVVRGRNVHWADDAAPDESREAYVGFMETLFRYGSVYSLLRDTQPVRDQTVQPGDVLVRPGRPGHAALVLDVATDPSGRVRALLGQGCTPPCSLHVLRAGPQSEWFDLSAAFSIALPNGESLSAAQLRRW